jgi:prephenate dehydrogenase
MAELSHEMEFAVIGAGGKMGTRIRRNLAKKQNPLHLVEMSQERRQQIRSEGQEATDSYDAIEKCDFVVLAVPDKFIQAVSKEIVPKMKSDATLILLDPAAAYGGELTTREDCTFVVAHPCHPPLFYEQKSPEAKADMFGGVAAEQDIVIALERGSQERYHQAEELCRIMFSPVMRVHRITVRDMAILEPAAAEVIVACAVSLVYQAMEESIHQGVPEEAARSFLLGHTKIPLAIVFGQTDFPFSDAAKVAIQVGFEKVIKPTWRDVFEDDVLKETIHRMIDIEG